MTRKGLQGGAKSSAVFIPSRAKFRDASSWKFSKRPIFCRSTQQSIRWKVDECNNRSDEKSTSATIDRMKSRRERHRPRKKPDTRDKTRFWRRRCEMILFLDRLNVCLCCFHKSTKWNLFLKFHRLILEGYKVPRMCDNAMNVWYWINHVTIASGRPCSEL